MNSPTEVDQQSAFASALQKARQFAQAVKQNRDLDLTGKRQHDDTDNQGPQSKKPASDSPGSNGTDPLKAAAAAAAQINQKLGNSVSNTTPIIMPPQNVTVNHTVPDRLVGLVIGKGGENIMRIQSETGCKLQFSPDSGGKIDRPCTITGPKDYIEEAKKMIQSFLDKGTSHHIEVGQAVNEIIIPGNKVGLIIGKSGETIKQLQEFHQVKMVMIQDSNLPTAEGKPLRITGDPQRCSVAMEAIRKLLGDNTGFASGLGSNPSDVPVPRQLVGIVIGKGGEMIRKIQMETGAKVQFFSDDGLTPDRMCTVTGSPDNVRKATAMVRDLVANTQNHQNNSNFNFGYNNEDNSGGYGTPKQSEFTYSVPKEKCGLVIGKGGQTIQEMCRITGAHIELKKNSNHTEEKEFTIKGSPDQCFHAVELISEKADIQAPNRQEFLNSNYGSAGQAFGNSAYSNQSFGNYNQSQSNNWNYDASSFQSQSQQPGGDKDNQAAWAAYYNQLYQNQQQQQQSPPGDSNNSAPQVTQAGSTQDYSAAWVDYYRQQGMHQHADMILQQSAALQAKQK